MFTVLLLRCTFNVSSVILIFRTSRPIPISIDSDDGSILLHHKWQRGNIVRLWNDQIDIILWLFYCYCSQFKCSGQSLANIPCQVGHWGQSLVGTCCITYMDLSYNKISSLDGLEHYKFLETLILDSNLIGDSIEIPVCPSLTTLSLNKNLVSWTFLKENSYLFNN